MVVFLRMYYIEEQSAETIRGEELAVAVCAKCNVRAQQKGELEFSLTWDMPVIHFGSRETKYCR